MVVKISEDAMEAKTMDPHRAAVFFFLLLVYILRTSAGITPQRIAATVMKGLIA